MVAIALALPAGVTACRGSSPTADGSTATSTATPRLTATAGYTPFLTPTVTATFTPLPTLDPAVPAPVSMTLAEANADALSWFDPARSPRIEWAGYVRREVIEEGLAGRRIYDVMTREFRPIEALSPVAIVVVASSFGLSLPLSAESTVFSPDIVGSDTVREHVFTIFDALSGARFATWPDGEGTPPDITSWRAAWAPKVAIVTVSPSARPAVTGDAPDGSPPISTPTAPATVPTPNAARLDVDRVPGPMRPVLAAYPLLPGSRWSWSVTARYQGVQWMAGTLTEAVEEGWVVADDQVILRSRRTLRHLSGVQRLHVSDDMVDEQADGVVTSIVWRTVRSDGTVAGGAQGEGEGAGWPFDPRMAMPNDFPLPAEPAFDPILGAGGDPYSTDRLNTDVPTRWGTFHHCATMNITRGNGQGAHRAICPGVGYVRSEVVVETTPVQLIEVVDLIDYDVVLPR